MEAKQAHLDEFRVWLTARAGRDIPEAHIEIRTEPLASFLAARPNQRPSTVDASGNCIHRYSWGDVTVQDFGEYRLFYDDRKWLTRGRGA